MTTFKHAAALATVILSLLFASAASAYPVDPPTAGTAATVAPAATHDPLGSAEPASEPPVQPNAAFQWDDAAVGAAGMLAILAMGATVLIGIRRDRDRSRVIAAS